MEIGRFTGDPKRIHAMRLEHTVCGDAFDIDCDVPGRGTWEQVTGRRINCPLCIDVIQDCRSVKVGKPLTD